MLADGIKSVIYGSGPVMPHPSWSGSIRLSLVSVAVRGYTAIAADKARISLNQLHAECHSRIRYKKVCEVHGEVPNDEIVMGYKYGPDQYAMIDTTELEALRSESDRAITIDKFVPPDEVDPIYFSGQTYYLVPDGRGAEQPYAVLQRAMADEKVCGVAQVVISNREQLVLVRPVGRLLTASVLHYAASVREPETFEKELGETSVSAQELKLAKTLIDVSIAKHAELNNYRNLYVERLAALVQSKVTGKKIVSPSAERALPVVNFMEALKASLDKKKTRGGAAKKLVPSVRARAAGRRRKSG